MTGRLLPRSDLTKDQRAAMLALMQEHFVGVTAELFGRDLAEKNWVILLEDEQEQMRGFSTLLLYTTEVDGTPARVVYSGDTVIRRDAWGSNALARTWLEAVRQLPADYWLLITSGFRTYRFLPVFWREFWPRFDCPTRPPLLDALARERFDGLYDAETGIVRLDAPQILLNGLKEIPQGRLADPHVAFFAHANPGHARGDELVCLCPLTSANQTPVGRRLVAV